MTEDFGNKPNPASIKPIFNDVSEADMRRRFPTVKSFSEAKEVKANAKAAIKEAEKERDAAIIKHTKKTAPNLVEASWKIILGPLAKVFVPDSPSKTAQKLCQEKIAEIQAKEDAALKKIEKFQHAPELKADFSRAAQPPNPKGPNKDLGNDRPDGPDKPNGRPSGKNNKSVDQNELPQKTGELSGKFNDAAGPKQEAGKAVEAFRDAAQGGTRLDDHEPAAVSNTANVLQPVYQSELDRAEAAYSHSPYELAELARVQAERAAERQREERGDDLGLGRER